MPPLDFRSLRRTLDQSRYTRQAAARLANIKLDSCLTLSQTFTQPLRVYVASRDISIYFANPSTDARVSLR